jgi:DNA polymerase III delta prime subunit
MIHVNRGEAPAVFTSSELDEDRAKAQDFFGRPSGQRAQQRYKFRGVTRMPGVRDTLMSLFNNKCAYCESLLEPTSNFTIDRFRPCDGAVNLSGEFDPDHYWWLAYEWFNVYPVCQVCNSMKGNRFPVAGQRAKAGVASTNLRDEQALLLDPCIDQPEQHLIFGKDGVAASETEQGRTTIDVLGLNRTGLVEARRAAYRLIEAQLAKFEEQLLTSDVTVNEIGTQITEAYDARHPFAALRRQMLAQWLNKPKAVEHIARRLRSEQELDALLGVISPSVAQGLLRSLSNTTIKKLGLRSGQEQTQGEPTIIKTLQEEQSVVKKFHADQANVEAYSVEGESGKEQYYRKRRLIERIELHNFKGIHDLTINFGASESISTPWLLLLGENGTGKSSILQAIALTMMGERHRTDLQKSQLADASHFVRYGTRAGYIKIYLVGVLEPIELHFRKGSVTFEGNATDPKTPLLAYGATRLLPRAGIVPDRSSGLARTRNLFNPFIPLHDADAWLGDLSKAQFDNAVHGLKDLMLLGDEDRLLKTSKGDIKVRALGAEVPLRDLSDGYQTVLALAVDIMSVMQERWDVMEIAEGIVLVDELDAHLHPRWKMQIVKRLRQTFPRVQFIVTSHDPLCLRGLNQQEVVVMRRDTENRIIALTDLPDPNALRIDQILTSEYFGMNSTVDPEVETLFDEYYYLLALRERTPQQDTRLEQLKAQLEGLTLLGATRRERLMLEAADQFVAQQTNETDLARRSALHAQARNAIVDLWDTVDIEGKVKL